MPSKQFNKKSITILQLKNYIEEEFMFMKTKRTKKS